MEIGLVKAPRKKINSPNIKKSNEPLTPDSKTTKKANATPETEKTAQTKPKVEPTNLFGDGAVGGGGTLGIKMGSFVTPGREECRSSGPFGGLVNNLTENMTEEQLEKRCTAEAKEKVEADWESFGSKESMAVALLMTAGKRHLNNDLDADDVSKLLEVGRGNCVAEFTDARAELERNEAEVKKRWAQWLYCMKTGIAPDK